MAGIPEKDRGWLMTMFIDCIPNEIDFIDGIIVMIILWKIGIVDLNKYSRYCRDEFREHSVIVNEYEGEDWMYKNDDHGRITELIVGGSLCGDDDNNCNIETYDLPPIIGHLERLNYLGVIGDCRSLPVKESCKLAHLQNLCLKGCTNLLRNFPVEIKLRHLTLIDVRCSQFQSPGHLFKWMIRQLPTLESPHFDMIEKTKPTIF
jgi:hypothetical protein